MSSGLVNMTKFKLFFSRTNKCCYLSAYYGWPAPMDLAIRQPVIDISVSFRLLAQIC